MEYPRFMQFFMSIAKWVGSMFKRTREDGLKKLTHREKYQVNAGWYNIFCTDRSRKKSRKNRYSRIKAFG